MTDRTKAPNHVRGPARRALFLLAHDRRHPSVTGGDEYGQQLAEALAHDGWKVSLWSSDGPGLAREEETGGVLVRRAPLGVPLTLWMWGEFLAGRAGPFDAVVEQVVASQRWPFLAKLWTPSRAVGLWFQDNRPLFEAAYPPGIRRALASSLQAILLVLYARGPVITTSERSRQWLQEKGVVGDRVALSYPRVVPPPDGGGKLPSFGERRDRFVAIGNFRPTKRFEEALEVLALLRAELPSAEAVVLGRPQDEAYLGRLRALAAQKGLGEHVQFLVGVDDVHKREVLASAKALTVHSPIEGFAWTVPEAGSLGVPAVVNPGVPSEVVEDGVAGARVPFGDPAAFARTLARWMRSEATWTPLSEGARRSAARFATPGVSETVRALLEGI